ncbi:hypothetical protein ACFPZ0_06270 [Streptomonospora nanhaiensis]|uniref:Uncharacterized protein n=1 Tax=Streptomonospora nanhaiensis TaxID=1323731 RepID=A0A853BKP5_9ACTN|nr:hypothetical protein [Streptomonospora nanhaiensis]MBV2365850.1 hypothetical protein [Streptomonospora nanhaiensis]MBX9387583.1 hypothetical protein [Streptomonospora nanhaiensis]NYI95227.1 hypothetical protein [Streptomonospora nanhaiensis]
MTGGHDNHPTPPAPGGDTAGDYRRVYSAAARMLWLQGTPAWREPGPWPADRRAAWSRLADLLGQDPHPAAPGAPAAPARHMIAAVNGHRPGTAPVTFGAAVESWRALLRAEAARPPGEPHGAAAAVSAGWLLVAVSLLDELAHRLAPGRPAHTVAPEGAVLAAALHENADALRAAARGTGIPAPVPAVREVAQIADGPGPVGERADLAEHHPRLRAAARAAAETVPTRAELRAAGDFSVPRPVADAAQDLLAVLADPRRPAWREAHDTLDPARHLVAAPRWEGTEARPVGFAERAAELRAASDGEAGPRPWAGDPDFGPEPGERIAVLTPARAAVLAAALDELAARLRPGRVVGTVHVDGLHAGRFLVHEFGAALRALYPLAP